MGFTDIKENAFQSSSEFKLPAGAFAGIEKFTSFNPLLSLRKFLQRIKVNTVYFQSSSEFKFFMAGETAKGPFFQSSSEFKRKKKSL